MEFDHLDWLWQFYGEWRQTSKLVNFQDFCLFPGMQFRWKFENDWKFLILSPSARNTRKSSLHVNLIILTDFHSFTVNEDKLQNSSIFKISAKVGVCDSGQDLKMSKISKFCSIHQENTCKSSLHSNLIILTDFHSFKVKLHKLPN